MTYNPSKSYAGIGKETTRGTAVSAGYWIPVEDPQWSPKINWISDEGMRGDPVDSYDQVAGVRHDEWSLKTNLYPDTFPAYVEAILGGTDVVGTSAPYTHTIPLKRTTDAQPPSYTILAFDGQDTKQMAGSQLSKLEITWAADGETKVSMDWIGNAATTPADPSSSYSTQRLVPGWKCSVSLLSGTTPVTSTNSSGTLTIDRKAASIFVVNQQGPYANWADKISVTGKMTFVAQATDTITAKALTDTPVVAVIRFTDPVTGYYAQFTMTTMQLENPVPDQGKQWLEIDTDFVAYANTTDAVGGGYSPIKFVGSNGQSSAYS